MKPYKTRLGIIQYKPSTKTIEKNSEKNIGYCLGCGQEQECVEPDAKRYQCESCEKFKVYGGEELLLMGLCY